MQKDQIHWNFPLVAHRLVSQLVLRLFRSLISAWSPMKTQTSETEETASMLFVDVWLWSHTDFPAITKL
jgi:hypothetical protein